MSDDVIESNSTGGRERVRNLAPLQKAALAIKELRSKLAAVEGMQREPIAIVGMGCRFPQADGLDAYWRLLSEGRDAIREVPPERWDLEHYFDVNPNAPGKISTRYGGFLDHVDRFDAAFFGISPREAEHLDPQQRLLLEVAWHALEDAGQAPSALRGTRTGVFVGITQMDYGVMQLGGAAEHIQAYTGTGNGLCFAAGRLAYVLGVHGPALSIDTACSSSMVALHQAVTALRNGECDVALVAGAQLNLTPPMQVFLSKTQSFAPDGRCRTFDEAANGFVLGEGIGVLVLRRLSDARARGDQIRAVIRASGVNHDGPASGLTVPNEGAQEALLRWVHERAGLTAADIDYVEAHGTATALGDPVEVGALRAVFGLRAPEQALMLGSVKTNFGHLNAAAGIAGLIKVVLMLEYEQVAPNLHFKQASSRAPWDGFTVRVPTTLLAWPRQARTRRAGVSSFGLSGTNTHTVLEEAPVAAPPAAARPGSERPLHLLCLSARSAPALRALAQSYLACAALDDGARLADLCFSANTGRSHFIYRLALQAATSEQMRARLEDYLGSGAGAGQVPKGGVAPLALLFAPHACVASVRALAETQPQVAATLARCAAAYRASGAPAPLFASDQQQQQDDAAVLSCQFALAELWRDWGVQPGAVAGSGIGALTALCVAGALDLEQAFAALAGQAVDAGVPDMAVYSDVDGALWPFVPTPGYRFHRVAPPARAARALADARFHSVLEIGGLPAATLLWPVLIDTLATLYRDGAQVAWQRYDAGYGRSRLRLPAYPFQRQRFWLDGVHALAATGGPAVHSAPSAATATAVAVLAGVTAVAAVNDVTAVAAVVAQAPSTSAPARDTARLLALQLQAAADSINDVVAQQLHFLRSRVAAAPPAAAPVPPAAPDAAARPAWPAGPIGASPTPPPPSLTAPLPAAPLAAVLGDWRLLLMAADDAATLDTLAASLANAPAGLPADLEGVIGAGAQRSMLVHRGVDDARLALGKGGTPRDLKRVISATALDARSVVFMFPGVGDQYPGMGQGLHASEPVFRASFERCCAYLASTMGLDLKPVLYPVQAAQAAPGAAPIKPDLRAMIGRTGAAGPAEAMLNQTVHSQTLMFIVEYALGQMWLARGLVPRAMIGYSIGEYAAACLAGVIGLEDALKLIVLRARMIARLPAGVLLAVPLAESRVVPLMGAELSLAIVSTPGLCIVGGPLAAIVALEQRLCGLEVVSRRLPGTHAFHTHMLAPLHDELLALVKGFSLHPPRIPYISNLTANWITDSEACDPVYWARHTWQTVRFADGLARLLDTEGRVFLELGPGQSLGSFVVQHPAALQLRDKIVLPSLKNRYEQQADEAFFLSTLGKLWLSGVRLDRNN